MRTIRQPDRAYSYTLSAEHPPIASVACDESVLIETVDAREGRLKTTSALPLPTCPRTPRVNPQTGALHINSMVAKISKRWLPSPAKNSN
jgi:hypothetical protein